MDINDKTDGDSWRSLDPATKKRIGSPVVLKYSIFLIAVLVFTIVILKQTARSERDKILHSEQDRVDIPHELIEGDMFHAISDLSYILTSEKIKDYQLNPNSIEVIKNLEREFFGLIHYKEDYDQIRLIGEKGMELIRVNYDNGNPYLVEKPKLQNKADRYYFKRAIQLKQNEMYISALDLNIENGEIEIPHNPTMRIASPVHDSNGKTLGLIIINLNGNQLINKIITQTNLSHHSDLMLLNSEGYFLKTPNSEYEWSFMYGSGTPESFKLHFPKIWNKVLSEDHTQFETREGLFSVNTIYSIRPESKQFEQLSKYNVSIKNDDRYWKLVSFVSAEVLYTEKRARQNRAIVHFSILSIVVGYLAFRSFKIQCLNSLQQIRIEESRERFITTLNSLDAAVYVADMETYEVLFANEFVSNNMGDVIGSKCYEKLQVGQDSPCSFCTNKYLTDKNGSPLDYYTWEYQNPSTQCWYQIQDKAIKWIDGRIVRLEIATDITARKNAEEELQDVNLLLEEANDNKNKFLSLLGHDLRNSIGGSMSIAEIVEENTIKEERREELIRHLAENIQSAYKLLTDLLMWGKASTGKENYDPTEICIADIFNHVTGLFASQLKHKDISLKINCKSPSIYADYFMLNTVIRNLTGNAIKYTNPGGDIILSSEAKDDSYLVCIEDNGIGMSEEKVKDLFSLKNYISEKGTNNEKGTGLGMQIVKEYVSIHGGKIWVESKSGVGTKVFISIPNQEV